MKEKKKIILRDDSNYYFLGRMQNVISKIQEKVFSIAVKFGVERKKERMDGEMRKKNKTSVAVHKHFFIFGCVYIYIYGICMCTTTTIIK